MAIIGIDSISIKIESTKGGTEAPSTVYRTILGVGVITNDYDKFQIKYSNTLDKIFKTLSYVERTKKIYCNYDFKEIYNKYGYPIHSLFLKEMANDIASLHIFYTVIPKSAKMFAYGKLEKAVKHKLSERELDFDKILNKTNAYFPLVGVWCKRDYLRENVSEIYLDGITPITFDGWNNIKDMPIKIFFTGDRCNALISTADILVYLIKQRLQSGRLRYELENFPKILPELKNKIDVFTIGKPAFKYISPTDNKNLNINNHLNHPIIFLFKDESAHITTEIVEGLEGYSKVYDFASKINGSVKFFDKQGDKGKIKKGDYLVYFTDDGEKSVKIIKGVMDNDINIASFQELKNQKL